ncbi:MAG: MCE family protein [Fibrobacter sp.]|jgi:phospholipid/cholesterol/gamma-HCH transport system substrate-binding protein|nr:MCE family protein [Fibrobacter sp.]
MKKNKSLYFVVGLVVLLAIVILVFGMFFLNDKDPRESFDIYYLRFTQVSTLVLDDPVKVNGVKLGKVEDIMLSEHRVVVSIRLRDDVKIPKDSEVRVQNIGIMGERQIGMILGDTNVYFSPGDTIDGIFDAGIAEAIGLAGEVFDSTKVLISSVKTVLNSTIASNDFQEQFKSILAKAEELENRVILIVKQSDPQLKKSLASLNEATVKVNLLLDSIDTPIQNLFLGSSHLISNADKLLEDLNVMTARLNDITLKLQNKDNTAGLLLNDRVLYDDLLTTMHSADSLFRIILQDGLDINVDFF